MALDIPNMPLGPLTGLTSCKDVKEQDELHGDDLQRSWHIITYRLSNPLCWVRPLGQVCVV